ncbi:hypothetical protein ASD76_06675 [Altererythrobacter sp. Root672]|nr:hypothetical protein ASD76_06675 [Altererythrobacter sp. Root672]
MIAQPAQAQEAIPVPAAAVIEQMCSSTGALQYRFGETGVPGGDRLMRTLSKGFPLPASTAPFDHAKPWSTEWSDRLFGIEYTTPDEEDEGAFAAFALGLDGVLAPMGWERQPADFDPPLYLLTLTGDWTWFRPVETEQGPTKLVLSLSNSVLGMTLACGRDDLAETHAREAFGDLPPGTPRPKVPEIPVPTLLSVADCAKPEVEAEVAKVFATESMDGFMASMVARTTYRDRLTGWMTWKLEQSGKISTEDLIDLSFSSIGSVSPGGDPFAQLGMIQEMFDLLGPVAEAEEAGDAAALCRTLVPLQDWFTRVDALTLEQTEATQAALTAEAARVGVSFD